MNPIHRFMLFFSLLLFPISLFAEKGSGEENVKVVDFAGLEPYLKKSNDTIYVVNFWATWSRKQCPSPSSSRLLSLSNALSMVGMAPQG